MQSLRQRSSLTPHISPLTPYPSLLTPYPSHLTPYPLSLTSHPLPLTSHPLPLISHLSPLPLTSHPLPLTSHLLSLTFHRLSLTYLLRRHGVEPTRCDQATPYSLRRYGRHVSVTSSESFCGLACVSLRVRLCTCKERVDVTLDSFMCVRLHECLYGCVYSTL